MCASHTRIFYRFLIIFIIILCPAFLDLASSFHLFVKTMKGETKERRKQEELLVRLAAAPGPCCLKVASWERQPFIAKSEGKYYKLEKKRAGGREQDRRQKMESLSKAELKIVYALALSHTFSDRERKKRTQKESKKG